jgi:hypothetical protein
LGGFGGLTRFGEKTVLEGFPRLLVAARADAESEQLRPAIVSAMSDHDAREKAFLHLFQVL